MGQDKEHKKNCKMSIDSLKGKDLNKEVYRLIKENWPTYPSDICRKLNLDANITNISKVKYHFDLLRKRNKIRTIKIDRALVGWPIEIEKLRVMHEFMRDFE